MKKIISLLLVLTSLFALFSCVPNEGNGECNADSMLKVYVYSVKVMAGTTPIVGAKIDLRNESADKKGNPVTDANGEAAYTSYTEIAGEWVAKIISIPDVYGIDKTEYLGKTYTLVNGSVKIEFAQVDVPQFEVKVVDQNGDAVVGAMVQICLDSCFVKVTDDAGVARMDFADGEYKANILSLPDGYTDSTEGAKYSFVDLKCEIIVTKN